MRDTEKKRVSKNVKSKCSAKSERRDPKVRKGNIGKSMKVKEASSRSPSVKSETVVLINDSTVAVESPEVCRNIDVRYVDDNHENLEVSEDSIDVETIDHGSKDLNGDHSSVLDNEPKEGREDESDSESVYDSVSSQGDSQAAEDEKLEGGSYVPETLVKEEISDDCSHPLIVNSDLITKNSHNEVSDPAANETIKSDQGPSKEMINNSPEKNSKYMKVHPKSSSQSSERSDDAHFEDAKGEDLQNEASIGTNDGSKDKSDIVENFEQGDREALDQKIVELEERMEKLEAELREVAALEISLYSVVAEHVSSAHKVHIPARRLSRIYIHACKHWSQDKRATVARNTISGLVLIAKSCGDDVPRLTFWLSNTIILREIITQTFGSSCQLSSLTRVVDSNRGAMKNEKKASRLKWKGGSGSRQQSKQDFMQFVDDWQETRTFTAALGKIESWIFLRIVDSIWWQSLMPNMQSPADDISTNKSIGRLLEPSLGDHEQGSLSINIWTNAFQEAFKRLCPVRGGGHECGCNPALARMVMEQCVARLDVAMFNAILRESAHEIPTDPVSDPIVDARVLPIPAGDLSFGSGAQLKNSVGNLSRWLTCLLDIGGGCYSKEVQCKIEVDDEPKYFHFLNDLADLLMLPKDMLMNRSIRDEVCPSISLPLIIRILCNFTPDEFCPDPVPGSVLEALNAECITEDRLSRESSSGFPYAAAPVVYNPLSLALGANKTLAVEKSPLARSISMVQRKGYTSDEELEELDSPLTCIVQKLESSPNSNRNAGLKDEIAQKSANARYELLREVWQA